jgi:hypothetical protein
MRVGLNMKMRVAINAMRELIPRVVRIPKKRRGITMPAVLKSSSNDKAGRGEIFRTRPRKRLKRGGCACR